MGCVLLIDALAVVGLLSGMDMTGGPDAPTRVEPAAVVAGLAMENLGLAFLGWSGWLLLRRADPLRPNLIESTPTGTRLRLNPAIHAGRFWLIAIGTAGLAFLASGIGIFVHLLPGYGWWAMGYVSLFGAMFAFGTWKQPPEGNYILDDQAAGTLSWRVWGLKGHKRRAVCRAAITDVGVQEQEATRSGFVVHQVVIHWQLPDGPPESDVVCGCRRLADAEALAGWIRGRLGLGEGPHPSAPSP
jgi:hypothetical protein